MADTIIWSGAKWMITGITMGIAAWSIPAAENQLGKWLENGWITFQDDPVDPEAPVRNQFEREGLFYGGLIANMSSYLFAKTLFANQTFPSFIVYMTVQVNLLYIYYDFVNKGLRGILDYHEHKDLQPYVDNVLLGYFTLISAWSAEISKIPLL